MSSRSPKLPQTGATTDPGNYRPIAVLSPFAKILERLVHNQLNHFLERENILLKHQFGFRKNHSTEQPNLELTDNLKIKIDKNEAICSIFLGLSKAFDTVNHQILLLTEVIQIMNLWCFPPMIQKLS